MTARLSDLDFRAHDRLDMSFVYSNCTLLYFFWGFRNCTLWTLPIGFLPKPLQAAQEISLNVLISLPGIGKSTLALQWVAAQVGQIRVLYVTGEESLQQLVLRAERLGVDSLPISTMAENHLESILEVLPDYDFLVIDSIQSLYSDNISAAPGSITQIRESAERLTRYAKQNDCAILFIGHVTKEGTLAGPKILEHMVDTVLYFEGDDSSRFRLVRSFKNRFGSVNEVGIFVMTDKGLREITNPSAMFLSGSERDISGSVVLATQEGTRPLLVEVQALLDPSSLANPRRLCVALDTHRLII